MKTPLGMQAEDDNVPEIHQLARRVLDKHGLVGAKPPLFMALVQGIKVKPDCSDGISYEDDVLLLAGSNANQSMVLIVKATKNTKILCQNSVLLANEHGELLRCHGGFAQARQRLEMLDTDLI